MLGHVMEWFYAGLGGIGQAPASSGYREIEIRPEVPGDLTFVNTSFHSLPGWIRSNWKKVGNRVTFEVEIPHNTKATLFLPKDYKAIEAFHGGKGAAGHPRGGIRDGRETVELLSGTNRVTALPAGLVQPGN